MRYEFLKTEVMGGKEYAYILDQEMGEVIVTPVKFTNSVNKPSITSRRLSTENATLADAVEANVRNSTGMRTVPEEVLRARVLNEEDAEEPLEPTRVVGTKPRKMIPRAFLSTMIPPGEEGASVVKRSV